MKADTKAKLVAKLHEWLEDEKVNDDVNGNCGVYMDFYDTDRNAHIYANAVEACVDAASLQNDLSKELYE